MNILTEAKNNYFATANQPLTADQPKNSNRWTFFQQDMRRLIEAHTDISQAILHAQTCGFDHRAPIAGNEQKVLLCRHCLIYEYPQFAEAIDKFTDSTLSIPSTVALYKGGPLVGDMLYFHVSYILAALSFNPNISTVCEIGGGYGGPARLWLTNTISHIKNYTIVDLPESLFYAEVFLRATSPSLNIVYCKTKEDFENTQENTVYLVPIQLAHLTSKMKFDLVTNTGSLAELSDEWVAYWSRWLDAQQCNQFYSHNYFGISVDRLFESRNIFAPLTPSGWRTSRVRINPPLMLLQSAERNAAEIMMVRSNSGLNREWIYQIQNLQQDDPLTLRDFAYYLFNLPAPAQCDASAELRLLKKALAELTFVPKELIYLATRISAAPSFAGLQADDQNYAQSALKQLQKTYELNYPQGRHTE